MMHVVNSLSKKCCIIILPAVDEGAHLANPHSGGHHPFPASGYHLAHSVQSLSCVRLSVTP